MKKVLEEENGGGRRLQWTFMEDFGHKFGRTTVSCFKWDEPQTPVSQHYALFVNCMFGIHDKA